MHTLKPSSIFRPASRPSSPAPNSPRPDVAPLPTPVDRPTRSISRLSLTQFRRPSPAPVASPAANSAIVQDGSYLEVLSLRLSEAVSRALSQPAGPAVVNEQFNGKRPIPAGRGHALGAIIATELNASRDNPHLRKAVLRTLQRPLSTLLTNLSAHLLPLLSSPAFLVPPTPTSQAPNPNPTQTHALALATFAGELLQTFDELGLGLDADARGDGLKAIRESLTSISARVVNPLAAGIKAELVTLITALEEPRIHSPTPTPAVLKGAASFKAAPTLHQSIISLQTLMPIYSRALSRYFATSTTQSNLASLEISLVWRALVALAHRVPPPPTPPASPTIPSAIVKKKQTGTPPTTPPSTRFMLKLPPSRPPSPPSERQIPSVLTDARALYDLLNTMPRPTAEMEKTRLAREAVDDAFDGLKALIALFESIQTVPERDPVELGLITADLPTLIALPVLLNTYVFPAHSVGARTVSSILGFSDDQYRQGCLTGFGRVEECTAAVGQRVLDVLATSAGVVMDPAAVAVVQWLKNEVAAAGT